MSYSLKRYNGSPLTTVAEGVIDDGSTSLTFVGKNFAGYGNYQNENYLYLLENFAGDDEPANAIDGQIWYHKSQKRIKYYDSTITTPGVSKWRTTGGAYTSDTTPGVNLNDGDFWFDTNTNQLKVWKTSGFTVIGPQAVEGKGTTNLESVSLKDNLGTAPGNYHAVVKAIADGNTIFIISKDTFQLDATANPIDGFTTIKQGITLVNSTTGSTTSDFRFFGTASDSDKLGGALPSAYVLKAGATFTGDIHFPSSGITIGTTTNDIKIFVDSANSNLGTIKNQVSNTLSFKITNNNLVREPLRVSGDTVIPGATETYDLGAVASKWNNLYAKTIIGSSYNDVLPTTTETYNLGSATYKWKDIYGKTIHADSFVGGVSGTASNADALKYGQVYVTATDGNTGSTIVARDSSGNFSAGVITATVTQARYADLAEKYESDFDYDPGMVVVFGGVKEITLTDTEEDTRVAGVVSTNPAYLMNVDSKGVAVALRGKVPCKVVGPVNKGDILVTSSMAGHAKRGSALSPAASIIGKSLEDKLDRDIGTIMIVVT